MPKQAHEALKKEARKKGLTGKARDRYIYGTLNKIERSQKKKRKTKKRK